MCFFGFFWSGEITTPSLTAFDPTVHLSWGDVAVDDPIRPKSIRIHLKRSKCDQFGAGVDIHLGRTTSPLCPVTAVLAYMASRQDTPGPFFSGRTWPSADEGNICPESSSCLITAWPACRTVCRPQFLDWGGYGGGPGGTGGFGDSGAGPVVKCSILTVYPYPPGAPDAIHSPISQPATGISIASTCVCGKRQYWPSQPTLDIADCFMCVCVYCV